MLSTERFYFKKILKNLGVHLVWMIPFLRPHVPDVKKGSIHQKRKESLALCYMTLNGVVDSERIKITSTFINIVAT